jgi:hypothetical protein
VIALAGFGASCGDDSTDETSDSNDESSGSSGDYCAKLPEYFSAMGAGMGADTTDPDRLDEWAAKAEEMAAISPAELQSHWDFIVDYSGRMAEAGGDPSALQEDDVEQNGEAGSAITVHGTQECELG